MRPGRTKHLLFGSPGSIAGTVYGTIVVMATVAAGSRGDATDIGRLLVIVGATVLVLWVAHVYSRTLAESLERGRRLDRAELSDVARRELAILAVAVAPIVALVLGAFGVLAEQQARTRDRGDDLAVQGARHATAERLGRPGTLAVIALNVLLGLVIVSLEVFLAH